MTRHASIRRRHATRLLALALAIMVVPVAFGAPQDLTQLAAPDLGSDPPAAQNIQAFDVSVASMTGAANLNIPVVLPPGRAGMVPSLSLGYSSQAPIYGSSIGSGWSLNIPEIRYDTSRARFRQVHYAGTTLPEWDDEPFTSTLSGGRPLVPVTGDIPTANAFAYYRARNDSAWVQYARYHRAGNPDGAAWSARTPGGVTHYFGEPGFITNLTTVDTADLVRVRAPLTHSADSFGNVVEYRYKFEADELLPTSIRYTLNPASGVDYFAEVSFVYGARAFCTVNGEPIGPISAQTDFRTGLKLVDGASPLIQIVATALDPSTHAVEHTRQIDLTYNAATESCTANHAPFRQLASVQERAWHTGKPQVVLPPTTFQYGSASIALTNDPTPPPLWLTTSEAVPNNLAWGERFNTPTWPTVEAMLVDLDGDGLVDRLVNTSAPPEQTPAECQVTWWRNMGDGNFEEQSTIQLPRLPWEGPRRCAVNYQRTELSNNSIFEDDNGGTCLPDHYGSYLAYRWIDVTGDGLADLVTAVHHDAWFDPSDPTIATPTGEPWPACTGDQSACPALDHNCIDDARDCPAQGGPCRMKPNLAEACVANADRVPCEDMTLFMGGGGGDFGVGDNSGHPNCSSFNFTRGFKLACGLYPWTLYRNVGNGEIDLQNPETILQPIALESDTGDTSMSAGGFWGRQQAVMDFDGDGAADVLIRGRYDGDNLPPGVPPFWWFAYLGNGVGGFLKNATTGLHEPYFFQMPQLDDDSLTHTQRSGFPLVSEPTNYGLASVRQVTDFNGDGAPDYLRHVEPIEQGDGGVNVHFNDGLGMRAFGEIGAAEETLVHPLAGMSKAVVTATDWSGDPNKPTIIEATRSARIQLADVDNDGRPDMYRTTPGALDEVFYNLGTDLSSADTTPDPLMEQGLVQSMAASETVVANKNIWQTTSGLVDVDGDGIGEAVWFDVDLHVAKYDPAGQPPRLLTQVANGRGAVTAISYAPLSDPEVVDNDPAAGSASPRTQWVVKSVVRSDDFESSTGTTTFRFDDPVFNQDDDDRYAFRGFKQVTIVGPRGNATIERYGFEDSTVAAIASPDWSGRLVETVTMLDDPDQDPTSVHSIARQSWQTGVLFGGKLTTYHPLDARTYVCGPAQTEAACLQSPAGFTKRHTSLTSIAGLLTVESETTLQDSESYDEGDRRSTQTFDLFTTGNVYRLRQRRADSFEQLATNEALYSSTQTDWDATYRVPIQRKVQLDAAGAMAVTEQTFDMVTGNLLTVRKPVQFDASGPLSTRTYDSRKLFVAEVINEVGHDNETDHEYGTGAVIAERGPNFRTCDPNCPDDPPEGPLPVRDGKRITVDGLGRPLQIEAVIPYYPGSPGGQTYKWSVVETLAYVDAPVGSIPAKVTDEKRIDHADSRFTSVITELDGHGRPIRTTEEVYGTASADAVTNFDYDVDGKLITVWVPDPSQSTSAQVAFAYSFDPIGRPTGMRRPDAIAPTPRSGIDVTYEGLTETREEVAGIGGSPPTGGPAKTKLVTDAFGRLVEVHELRLVGPETFTLTTYAYSPRDEVSTIVSSVGEPDEVTTLLDHDLAGRRTQITRGARVWKYSYDKNGNLSTETVPSPDPPDDELDYRTSFVYDALDRLTSKSVPQRDLSDEDYELFGAAVVNYVWDQGLYNRMGRIVYFNTRGPNGTAVFNGRYYYDSEGNITTEDRTWNVTLDDFFEPTPAVLTLPERGEGYRYAAFGRIKTAINADGSGATGSPPSENNSTVNTIYDDRGNPLKLQLQRPGLSNQYVGVQTRNVAGLVTKRRTDQTGQAMTYIESTWVYDKLGRVTSQAVVKNPGALPADRVAQQDLTYWGNDDPKTLDHWIGASNHKRFEYSFDRRHQLTGVTETAAGGAFAAAYTFGPAGRFDRATVTPTALPGSDVRPRDVEYSYMANDPEAVSSLDTPIGGGQTTPYASYEYDSVGNQISRTYWTDTALPTPQPLPPGSELTWQFLYDGEDQLRRVTGPDGNIEEYWYDHNGQRALIRTRPVGGSITWRWFHNNTEVEWKTDDLADTTPVIEHTLAYASLGTPVARIQDRNDRTEFEFHALTESTMATVESGLGVLEGGETAIASGTVNTAFLYSPFGELVETAGSEINSHRRRFNDKYEDATSGLSYYGVRYFDPVSMNWTQADPSYRFAPDAAWADPRRANLYSFDAQNPLRYIDPDGRDFGSALRWIGGGLTAAVGGAVALAGATGVVVYVVVSDGSTEGGIDPTATDRGGPEGAGCGAGCSLADLERASAAPVPLPIPNEIARPRNDGGEETTTTEEGETTTASPNPDEPPRRPRKGIEGRPGGGKNAPKINQRRLDSLRKQLEAAREQLKQAKTKAQKAAAKAKIRHITGQMKKSESHSQSSTRRAADPGAGGVEEFHRLNEPSDDISERVVQ